jgi:hypothetical protein
MIELLIDPALVSSVIKVYATGNISKGLSFDLFSIITSGNFIGWCIRLLNLLDVFIVQGLTCFNINQAIPCLVELTNTHRSTLEVLYKDLNCQKYHFSVESDVVVRCLYHTGSSGNHALLD